MSVLRLPNLSLVAGVLWLGLLPAPGSSGPAAGSSPASPIKAADLPARLAGIWDATMQLAAQDGAPPVVLNGTEVNTTGGRGSWVVGDFRSQLEGHPFQGHAILAFDAASGRFRRVWADSTSPAFWTSEGVWDSSTSTLTMWIETTDTQGQKVRWREEMVLKNGDTRTFTMYVPGPESTEAAGVTIVYHRRDAAVTRTAVGPALAPPSPEHDLLRRSAGTWSARVDDRRDATKPATSSKGTETGTICCGGLFLAVDFADEARDAPLLGHALMGYDARKKKYVLARVDTGGEPLLLSEGDYDAVADALTMRAEVPGGRDGTGSRREVMEWKGRDQRTSTIWMKGSDGRESAAVVTRYRRAK